MSNEIISILAALKDALIYFDKKNQSQELQDEARALVEKLQSEPTEEEIEKIGYLLFSESFHFPISTETVAELWKVKEFSKESKRIAKVAIKAVREQNNA